MLEIKKPQELPLNKQPEIELINKTTNGERAVSRVKYFLIIKKGMHYPFNDIGVQIKTK
jgi:hypothetical protein